MAAADLWLLCIWPYRLHKDCTVHRTVSHLQLTFSLPLLFPSCAILSQTPPGFAWHAAYPTDTGKQVAVERSEWTSGRYSSSLLAYVSLALTCSALSRAVSFFFSIFCLSNAFCASSSLLYTLQLKVRKWVSLRLRDTVQWAWFRIKLFAFFFFCQCAEAAYNFRNYCF